MANTKLKYGPVAMSFHWVIAALILTNFVLAWLVTGQCGFASAIMGAEVFTKSALYFGHEMAWNYVREKGGE